MKVNIILEINDGFRVDRKVIQAGESVVVMSFADKSDTLTDAQVATIGKGNKRFVTNFATAAVSVIDNLVRMDDPTSPALVGVFRQVIFDGLDKMMQRKAEGAQKDLRADLTRKGMSDAAIDELFKTLEKAAGRETADGK